MLLNLSQQGRCCYISGIILGMGSANERCYIVTPPLFSWAHTLPWSLHILRNIWWHSFLSLFFFFFFCFVLFCFSWVSWVVFSHLNSTYSVWDFYMYSATVFQVFLIEIDHISSIILFTSTPNSKHVVINWISPYVHCNDSWECTGKHHMNILDIIGWKIIHSKWRTCSLSR